VGAALDIVSGRFRTAPSWMTRVGLEWLFRLVQEPRRLARRYLVDDPWIIYWAIRERLVRRAR
jgi:N-acetylglucosaminyldiphosphoundecaprenol N-acetyl-beta-D-mannosaminyltransferase